MEQFKTDVTFFLGLVAGGVVGGIAAALLMPRSEPAVREDADAPGIQLHTPGEAVAQRAQQAAQDVLASLQRPAIDAQGA